MTIGVAALLLRLAAAAIFMSQGARKLFAPAAAPHGRASLEAMIRGRGLPAPARLALAVSATELIGGIFFAVGLVVRVAALPLAVVLLVAMGFKRESGFLGGWDWPFSVVAIVLAVLVLGAGAYSLDALMGLS